MVYKLHKNLNTSRMVKKSADFVPDSQIATDPLNRYLRYSHMCMYHLNGYLPVIFCNDISPIRTCMNRALEEEWQGQPQRYFLQLRRVPLTRPTANRWWSLVTFWSFAELSTNLPVWLRWPDLSAVWVGWMEFFTRTLKLYTFCGLGMSSVHLNDSCLELRAALSDRAHH